MPLKEGATNEILPFAPEALQEAGDVLSLEAYKDHPMRLRGHMAGLALRELQNTESRQASHVAAGIGQFIANRFAAGVRDDADLDKIEAGLLAAVKEVISGAVPLPLAIENGGTGNKEGNAPSAAKLATARAVRVNLASKAKADFDGSKDIEPGVTGELAIESGGTGAATRARAQQNLVYELCEFYFFRHPTLKTGFQPAQGGLLANAATLYPDAWAYLQTTEGQKLCKTEAQWQALTTETWATLADGSKVGWNGIGGAPWYAPNTATGALRLPDLRGMYAEASGYDGLGVGQVHGDGIRPMSGYLSPVLNGGGTGVFNANGVAYAHPTGGISGAWVHSEVTFDPARVVPTANKNQPRAWGALACVYLGTPK